MHTQQRLKSAWAAAQSDQSLRCPAWRKLGSLVTHWAHSEDSDQTGRMPRLIWVFTGCTCHLVAFVMRWHNYAFMESLNEYPQHTHRVKRIWYLSPMRAAKVQASLHILAQTSRESRGTFRRKARSLAPLNGWACTVKICHDGMLEDTNSLDGAQMFLWRTSENCPLIIKKIPSLSVPLLQTFLLSFVSQD